MSAPKPLVCLMNPPPGPWSAKRCDVLPHDPAELFSDLAKCTLFVRPDGSVEAPISAHLRLRILDVLRALRTETALPAPACVACGEVSPLYRCIPCADKEQRVAALAAVEAVQAAVDAIEADGHLGTQYSQTHVDQAIESVRASLKGQP